MKQPIRRSLALVAALIAPAFCAQAQPAASGAAQPPAAQSKSDAKPAAGSSLDDELFQDLDLGKPAAKPATTPPKQSPTSKSERAGDGPTAGKSGASGEKPAAQPKPAAKSSALDEELLKQLEGDDAPRKKPQQQPSPAGPGGGGKRIEEPDSDNPFIKLSRQVRDAEQRLRGSDSGDQTQELQRRIVDDLEKLIAQIEQQQAQQSQSQSKKPGAPKPGEKRQQPKPGQQQQQRNGQQQPTDQSPDSSERLAQRKNEKPTGGKLKDLLEKVWGELPERERQDVMQASFDDFPAKYQYVIEEYFKTLLKRQE